MSAGGVKRMLAGKPRKPRRAPTGTLEDKLTPIEAAFFRKVAGGKPGTTMHRHGWPDFLLMSPAGPYCVEVKSCSSEALRQSQREMFAILESMGIKVYVWSPDRPETLSPWRQRVSRPTLALLKDRES